MPTGIETLAARIADTSPTLGRVRLVCVDGPAGSGKTTLTARLADNLRSTGLVVGCVHGDEVYEGWPVVAGVPDRVDAFAALGDRLGSWLLDPWAAGLPARHRVWDWYADVWGEERSVPDAGIVILEGVALGSRTLRARAVLSVWVEADPAVRLGRVLARDGAALREEMLRWQVDEAAWHALDGTRAGADVRIAT